MTSQRRQPDATRKQILDTALILFTDRGYFAASMQDIRQQTGLSTGAIYHHFDSKESIARALYDELLQQMTVLVEEVLENERTTRARHRRLTERLFQLTEEEPTLVRFIMDARHREFLPDAPPVCSSKPFQLMMQLVEEGMQGGELRKMEPMVAGALLFGPGLRMIQLALGGILPTRIGLHLDEIVTSSWRSLAS